MDHTPELVQAHDRTLTVLQEQLKQLTSDVKDVKSILQKISSDHNVDDRNAAKIMHDHKLWTAGELKLMTVEIAVLKTKVVMIGVAAGGIASAAISLVTKLI